MQVFVGYDRFMADTSDQPNPTTTSRGAALQRWHKIVSLAVAGCLVGAIGICVVASPDFRDTIGEFVTSFGPEPGVDILRNVTYYPPLPEKAARPAPGAGRLYQGDLYLPNTDPEKKGPPRPAVVVVHGGSWSSGSKDDLPESMISRYFARHGMVALCINYRLLGEGGEFPADVVDVKRALAYLARFASEWNIDPQKLVVTGTSSGAYAALMAAYTPDEKPFLISEKDWIKVAKVRAVLSFYGPTEYDKLATNKYLQKYLEKDKDPAAYNEKLKQCSPITYVKTAVPTFLAHGTEDCNVPIQQSIDLATLLGREKVPCEFVRIEGASHFVGGASRALVLDRMRDFLNRVFQSKSLQESQ